MTEEDFKSLPRTTETRPRIGDGPGPDRTLLYGYSSVTTKDGWENVTHHVYRQSGLLHVIAYVTPRAGEELPVESVRPEEFDLASAANRLYAVHASGETLPIDILIPRKRLYPEACDADFSRNLIEAGASLPFTTFDGARVRPEPFAGLVASAMSEYVPERGLAR